MAWTDGVSRRSEPISRTATPDALTIAYSADKEDLFLDLVTEFNLSRPRNVLPVHLIRRDSAQMMADAVMGLFSAVSPDSSVWLSELEIGWQEQAPGAAPLAGTSTPYALSPVVIAMSESVALEMGYPDGAIGWQDLVDRVSVDPSFKWSHPSASTATGLLAMTADFYAGAGKSENLTRADLKAPGTLDYISSVESTVQRYGGESEDRVVVRMLAEGGHPLDAFVAQEQSVTFFNQNSEDEKLVAVYPGDGTFWMDHPLVLLNGPWVTSAQRDSFREFADFVNE